MVDTTEYIDSINVYHYNAAHASAFWRMPLAPVADNNGRQSLRTSDRSQGYRCGLGQMPSSDRKRHHYSGDKENIDPGIRNSVATFHHRQPSILARGPVISTGQPRFSNNFSMPFQASSCFVENMEGFGHAPAHVLTPFSISNNSTEWPDIPDLLAEMFRKSQSCSYTRDPKYFHIRHAISPDQRAVLLAWLTEVSQHFKLQRETYYITIDVIDRFLSKFSEQVMPENLQAIGLAALLIAAKAEEVPRRIPKLRNLIYLGSGSVACEADLKQVEVIILKALEWNVHPVTPIAWLTAFLQIGSSSYGSESSRTPQSFAHNCASAFVTESRFSGYFYSLVCQLIDLIALDSRFVGTSYFDVALAALFHMTDADIIRRITGVDLSDLSSPIVRQVLPVISWTASLAQTLFTDHAFLTNPTNPRVTDPDVVGVRDGMSHAIQTHTNVDLSLLHAAHRLEAAKHFQTTPPVYTVYSPGCLSTNSSVSNSVSDPFLTPPPDELAEPTVDRSFSSSCSSGFYGSEVYSENSNI